MLNNLGILAIILEYIVTFIVVFVANYLLFIRKNKRYNKKKIPIEMSYIVNLYKIDIKSINYRRFVWIYSLINTFIITTIYIIVLYLVEKLIWQIIIGLVLLVLMIIICYGILGRIYERKGDKNV